MKNRVSIAVFISLLCSSLIGYTQDLHFSQFNTTPSYLNPALTGQFNGDGRITLNHRSQWRSVSVPYQTFASTVDFNGLGSAKYLGTGISAYYDQAGDSKFTTLKVDASAAYSLSLSYDRRHSLSLGLQAGIRQLTIDYTALRFDNQYIPGGPGYNPNNPNGENFIFNKLSSPTASAGLAYIFSGINKTYLVGFGAYNLIPTPSSFFVANSIYNRTRYNIQLNLEAEVDNNVVLTPVLFLSAQGEQFEALGGMQAKKILLDDFGSYQAIGLGLYGRFKDAAILSGNYEFNDFNFGLSYDFNISSLRKSSGSRGAYEISLIYVYRSKNSASSRRFKTCPVFI